MTNEELLKILNDIKNENISVKDAAALFRDMPFKDLDFVKFDYHRDLRKGLGEVVYCKNKTIEQLEAIGVELKKTRKDKIIYSRISRKKAKMLLALDPELEHNEKAHMVFKNKDKSVHPGLILVLTAGTTDIPVAEEAICTATVMGNKVERHYDVGIAGIHRLFAIYDRLQEADVIVVVAGMEGALPSVVSGLVSVPVIAVPTSIGYGANFGGLAALLSMLNSCSPGISVVNINNGFGAGYLAGIINKGKAK